MVSYFCRMNRASRPAPTPPASYHHGDLRRALVEAAMGILETEGLAVLSLRATARRAGVSHAAPYHHFADKVALLNAVAGLGFAQLRTAMEDAARSAPNPLQGLQAFAVAYTRFAHEHPALFRLMFTQENLTPEYPGPAPSKGIIDDLVIADLQRTLGCPYPVAQQINLLLWSTVHGLAMLWLDGRVGNRNPEELERLTYEISDRLGRVLA